MSSSSLTTQLAFTNAATREMTYEKRITCQGFLLIEVNFPRGTTNQKHYPDLRRDGLRYGISALVSQTSFHG